MITVDSKRTAWKLVNTLINASYHKDEKASKRAGYDIYIRMKMKIFILVI